MMTTRARRYESGRLPIYRPGTANDNDCDVCEVPAGRDCRASCDCDICQKVVA